MRTKGCVHLIPGNRAKGTIKVKQYPGRSVRRVVSGRDVNQIYGQISGQKKRK
jgi:hypothetical protein